MISSCASKTIYSSLMEVLNYNFTWETRQFQTGEILMEVPHKGLKTKNLERKNALHIYSFEVISELR